MKYHDNDAGIMSDIVQDRTSGVNSAHWRTIARRGQYRIFGADEYTYIHRPIQPVPTPETKGVFVFSSLYDHIVVGPTAENQESRFDRTVDPAVADALTGYVLRILPDLDPKQQHLGHYVGIRPATEHRDYQIAMTPESNWIAAAGIRSTGLTASLGIGRHIVNLLQSVLHISSPPESIRTSRLPEIHDLVENFNKNSDGFVLIHGYMYRVSTFTTPCRQRLSFSHRTNIKPYRNVQVTHPLTRLGFRMRSGIASVTRQQR
jgi:glycerol-3-phosphate dehydrogenase